MMKYIRLTLALLLATLLCVSALADTYDQDQVNEMMEQAWEQAMTEAAQDPERVAEVTPELTAVDYYDGEGLVTEELEVRSITDGTYTMRYLLSVIGEPDENGLYPLYICLHGGGSDSEEGYVNNAQWVYMLDYYRESVTSGVYVAVRGITNNWNLHFEDASYPLYDRLIEDMLVFYNVDPDRVYLLGFSAGGDGVYAVSPRMADRFAAVDESSGHPNGVSLLNNANLPTCIQAGIRDTMFTPQRSVLAAGFDRILTGYAEAYGFGYTHTVYIHVPEGHNYADNDPDANTTQLVLTDPQAFVEAMDDPDVNDLFPDEVAYSLDSEINDAYLELVAELGLETVTTDTNAVRFVNQYTRDAHPARLVWDLGTRAASRETTSFYWLQADSTVNTGLIAASFDAETNTFSIDLQEKPNGDFSILLHPSMVDFSSPVYVRCGDGIAEVNVQLDEEALQASMADTLDYDLAYAAKVSFNSLGFGE